MLPPLSVFSFLIFSMLTAFGLFKLYSKILILDILLKKESLVFKIDSTSLHNQIIPFLFEPLAPYGAGRAPQLRSRRGPRPPSPASELREGRSGETEARIRELGALILLLSLSAPLTKPEAGTLLGAAAPWPYTVLSVRRPPFSTACLPTSPTPGGLRAWPPLILHA